VGTAAAAGSGAHSKTLPNLVSVSMWTEGWGMVAS
jgi:hypothetical protein